MSGWFYLAMGVCAEIVGTFSLKLSQGFAHITPSIIAFLCFVVSLVFVNLALKTISVGVAYAIWSGVGIVAITTLGFFYFGENINIAQVIFIALILIGIIGLYIAT